MPHKLKILQHITFMQIKLLNLVIKRNKPPDKAECTRNEKQLQIVFSTSFSNEEIKRYRVTT